jgi:zinc transporter 1/2/3
MVAMLAAIATLVVDTIATGYFRRTVARKAAAVVDEPPAEPGRCGDGDLEGAADGHHGHAHGMSVLAPAPPAAGDDLVRHRVVSHVRTATPCARALRETERRCGEDFRRI